MQNSADDLRIQSLEALDTVRLRCQALLRQKAWASGGAVLLPIPGVDILADMALLLDLLSAINREFGLDPKQIAALMPPVQSQVRQHIGTQGFVLVGSHITSTQVVALLKQVSVRLAAKQVLKFIPLAGQATAALIAAWAMHHIGQKHINDCDAVMRRILINRTTGTVIDV